jgi:hypothetical protein
VKEYTLNRVMDDAHAPILAVETHVLVVVPREGNRYAYDFAARVRTAEELAGPQLVLQQMIDSSRLLQ